MTNEEGLDLFVTAQEQIYARALGEIRRGKKCSHWMWFIFPQLAGLGRSATSKLYGLAGADEARAYLAHPLLGARYAECVEAIQDLPASDPVAVFGEVDAVKLRSSLTLFEVTQIALICMVCASIPMCSFLHWRRYSAPCFLHFHSPSPRNLMPVESTSRCNPAGLRV